MNEKNEISRAAAAMGRKGRAVNSEAQKAAARESGKKGGRPRKIWSGKIVHATDGRYLLREGEIDDSGEESEECVYTRSYAYTQVIPLHDGKTWPAQYEKYRRHGNQFKLGVPETIDKSEYDALFSK